MISSLQTKLLVAVSLLAVSAVVAVGLAARQSARHEFRAFQELVKKRPGGSPTPPPLAVISALDGRCCDGSAVAAAAGSLAPHEAIIVVDEAAGQVVATAGAGLNSLRDLKVDVHGDTLSIEATRINTGAAEGIALTFKDPDAPRITLAGGAVARVHLLRMPEGGRDQPAAAFLGSIDRRLLLATSIVGVLAVVTTWWLTRRLAAPIGELRDAARDLAHGNLSRRVEARGSDEVAELSRAFNAMADGLEHQALLRRNLVHDVAHELRTPLTALRCRLETIIDGLATDPKEAVAGANEEVLHLSRLVDDLQEVALAEARELRLSIGDVDVATVVASAARAAGLDQDRRLRVDVPAALTARGDVVRLRQVILNLLTNADRHTPGDGEIVVSARFSPSEAIVEVRNTGEVLDAEQTARVFDRFYRADPSRQRATGGSGLGLAIVKHLVEAQGGRVWAERREDGMTFGFAVPSN